MKTNISFGEAVLVFAVALAVLVSFTFAGMSTACILFIVAVLIGIYNVVRVKKPVDECIEAFCQKVHVTMPALLILILSGFNAAAWAMSGTTPFLVVAGLKALTPATCLVLSYVLMFFSTLITGQAWGMLPTIGMACFTVANAMGINPCITAGVLVSSMFLGETLSPISDGTNYQAAMMGENVMTVIKGNMPVTIPGAIVGLIGTAIIGFTQNTNGNVTEAQAIAENIAASGNYTVVSLLPIVVLFVLILLKVALLPCILSSSLVAMIIAMVSGRQTFISFLSGAWSGTAGSTGDALVDTVLSGSGANGMSWAVFIVLAAAGFASQLILSGVPEVVLKKAEQFCSTEKSLCVTTVVASVLCHILTGSQYGSITLINNMFVSKFKEKNIAPTVLARCTYNYSSILLTFVPWSTMCAGTFALIGFTDYFGALPYCICAFAAFVFIFIWIALGKFSPKASAEASMVNE